MREPAVQFIAPLACVQTLDAKPKLSECHRANIKFIKRASSNKRQNFRLGLYPTDF